MGVKDIFNVIKDHSGTILSGVAVVGVGVTGYFSADGALKSVETIKPEMTRMEKIKAYGKCYWKAGVSFALTSLCIIGSDRIHVGKEVGLAAAVALNKDRVKAMKDKITEKYGVSEANDIYESVLKEEAKEKANATRKVKDGEILVYEPHTEQYIVTTPEKIEQGLKKTNEQLNKTRRVTINYFNTLIGGKYDSITGNDGWNLDDMEQAEEWSVVNHLYSEDCECDIPLIELVKRVYMHEVTESITPSNYLRDDEEIQSGDIPVLFFTVDPKAIDC